MLRATDVESADAGLTFTVTALPAHGTLKGPAWPWLPGTLSPRPTSPPDIAYFHDGSESNDDGFDFTLTDGGGGAADRAAGARSRP